MVISEYVIVLRFGCVIIEQKNKINRILERCRRLIYSDKKSSFENLLDKDKSVSIYHKNIGVLQSKCIKYTGISPDILMYLLPLTQPDQYNLRNRSQFSIPNVKTVNHGFESLGYLGPKIWETIPPHLKEIDS